MQNKIYEISVESLYSGAAACKDIKVTWDKPACANIKCYLTTDKKSLVVTVPPDCDDSCLYVTLECLDTACHYCPTSERVRVCPCTETSDCPDCHTCSGNLCVSTCPADEFCLNNECCECDDENPCANGGDCNSCRCECPPEKPYISAKGICVECTNDNHCPAGQYCDGNGNCVPEECATGVFNIEKNKCVDCNTSGDCTGDNECCDGDNNCVCCNGFVDYGNGCEPKHECDKDSECQDCFTCDGENCVPVVCPVGYICVDGICVKECNCSDGGCPEGSACVPHPTQTDKCYCKDCSQFSCENEDCASEYGCGCDDANNCVPDGSCDLGNLDLEWVFSPGQVGTPAGSATALTIDSITITPLDQIYNNGQNSTYRNYDFTVVITNNSGSGGQWYYTNGIVEVPLASTGNTISVELEDLQQNLGFFALKFVDSDPCTRTLTIPFSPNFNLENPLQAATNGWIYLPEENSGGCNAYTGGTSGSWSLCVNSDTDFVIQPNTLNLVTSGTIDITLGNQVGSCSPATITGCGIANGTVDVECKGLTQNVAIPEFQVNGVCCDPLDPDCVNTGEPCDVISSGNIPLVIYPLFGTNGTGTASEAVALINVQELLGTGEFSVTDLLFIASKICWSSTGNPASADTGETVDEGNNFGVGYNNPFEYKFDYVIGTCIHVGDTCDIIVNCKDYSGEACVDACNDFEVIFTETSNYGEFYMIPSNFGYVSLNENWTVKTYTDAAGTSLAVNQTINPSTYSFPTTIDPGSPPGRTLSFLAKYVDVIKISVGTKIKRIEGTIALSECEGRGYVTRSVGGCTNPDACNYNPAADTNDGSCYNLTSVFSYNCAGGGLQSSVSGLTIYVDGVARPIGYILADGSYTVYGTDGSCNTPAVTLDVNCCGSTFITLTNVVTDCDPGGGADDSSVDVDIAGGLAPYNVRLLLNGVEEDSDTLLADGTQTFITAYLTSEVDYVVEATDANGCTNSVNVKFLCCTAPASINLDADGAGATPATNACSAGSSVSDSLANLGGADDICGSSSVSFYVNGITGTEDITVTINGDVSMVAGGTPVVSGTPTTFLASTEMVTTFTNKDSGSSSIKVTYCAITYTFNFVHDCAPSLLTADELFVAVGDARFPNIYKLGINPTTFAVVNTTLFKSSVTALIDIAYVNGNLYYFAGYNLYIVNPTGPDTLVKNFSSDLTGIVYGLLGVPGEDKLIVAETAIGFTETMLGEIDLGTNTYTSVVTYSGGKDPGDLVLVADKLYVNVTIGTSKKVLRYDYAAGSPMTLVTPTLMAGTLSTDLGGMCRVTTSAAVSKNLGGKLNITSGNPSVFYELDLPNGAIIMPIMGSPTTGGTYGMASVTG